MFRQGTKVRNYRYYLIKLLVHKNCQLRIINTIFSNIYSCVGLDGLSSLKHLLLSHNKIFELSEGLFKLERLERLDLYSNEIRHLPQVQSTALRLTYTKIILLIPFRQLI
jgi:Leucine-rich repeat (LRR) protein